MVLIEDGGLRRRDSRFTIVGMHVSPEAALFHILANKCP